MTSYKGKRNKVQEDQQERFRLYALVALLGGMLLSFLIPILLLKHKIYSDEVWIILAPGWILFSPGRDDFREIMMAFIFDTAIYGIIIYFVVQFFDRLKDRFRT